MKKESGQGGKYDGNEGIREARVRLWTVAAAGGRGWGVGVKTVMPRVHNPTLMPGKCTPSCLYRCKFSLLYYWNLSSSSFLLSHTFS